jgi:hypothetical protein
MKSKDNTLAMRDRSLEFRETSVALIAERSAPSVKGEERVKDRRLSEKYQRNRQGPLGSLRADDRPHGLWLQWQEIALKGSW